jgi:hypothetical protein
LADIDKPVSNPYESNTEINPRFQPLTGGSFGLTAGQMTPWITASFADRWYADALVEAKRDGADSRRREIVFSVACAECFLFEWVRDTALNRNYKRLNDFFRPGCFKSVTDKWKDIPKELVRDGLITSAPDNGGTTWSEFDTLVEYRNGLLHAAASRPATPEQPEKERPIPPQGALAQLGQGWAAGTVKALIVALCTAAGTNPPDWL